MMRLENILKKLQFKQLYPYYWLFHMCTQNYFIIPQNVSLKTTKTWVFLPIFWHFTIILYDFTDIILLFVGIILFVCSVATLHLECCLGDSNVAAYSFNTFLFKQWSVTRHLPSSVTDCQVDNFDRLFPGDSHAVFCNRRLPRRIRV